jgi:hypothetical protein
MWDPQDHRGKKAKKARLESRDPPALQVHKVKKEKQGPQVPLDLKDPREKQDPLDHREKKVRSDRLDSPDPKVMQVPLDHKV